MGGSFQVPEDFLQALHRHFEGQRKTLKPILFIILGGVSALGILGILGYQFSSRVKKPKLSVKTVPTWKETELSLVSLGSFVVPLQRPFEKEPLQMVQLEMVLLCSDPQTASYLRRYTIPARSQIFSTLHALSQEDVLSYEGKKRVREFLKQGLNAWLPEGYVRDVYFSKLIVNSS